MSRAPLRRTGIAAGIAAAVAGLLLVGLLAAGRADARKATPPERRAMISAVYDIVRYFPEPARCRNAWITRVSAYRPRTGVVWDNVGLRRKRHCTVTGSYFILRRATPDAAEWLVVHEGTDGPPPCRYVTARMARELGLGRSCAS